MKRLILLLWVFLPLLMAGQAHDTVTLESCYQLARKNYPLTRQVDLLGKSSRLKISNYNKNWLPAVNVNGSTSLQSDITEVEIILPANLPAIGMPPLSKDWYKLTLDVNQTMYDGSLVKYQKKLENSNLKADEKSLEVELYKLKDRINQVYFSILLSQENEKLLNDTKALLEARMKEIRSAVLNGTLMASSEDALKVQVIQTEQQLAEIRIDRSTAYGILSELTSTPIPESAILVMPTVKLASTDYENKRPEYQLFDLQQDRVGVMKSMVITKWNPKLWAFGQVGYGRPGFNMLSNDFTPWWIFGAKLTWNPWNWNQNKNERKIYDIQDDILKSQQETFDKNSRIEADRGLSEITRLSELLLKDSDIIALREKITRTAASQMDNGVITSSDYISRVNEETQARLLMELHKIQLVKAKLNYLYIQGKL